MNAAVSVSLRGVVFDLWNTLVPYPPVEGQAALAEVAQILGADPDALAEASIAGLPLMRASFEDGLREVSRRVGVEVSSQTVTKAARAWNDRHSRLLVARADAVATLRALRRKTFRTELLTNCAEGLPEVWSRSELARHFDAAVFSCLDGVAKPDFGSYVLVAERLGLRPEECADVGDTAGELFGAREAGMRPLLLRTEDERAFRDWPGGHLALLGDLINLLEADLFAG